MLNLGKPIIPEQFEGEGPDEVDLSQEWITYEKAKLNKHGESGHQQSVPEVSGPSEQTVRSWLGQMAKIWKMRDFRFWLFGV